MKMPRLILAALLAFLLTGIGFADPPPRILYYHLSLVPSLEHADREKLLSLYQYGRAAGITDVMIVVPSVWTAPDAVRHPTVVTTTHVCRMLGIRFIWARELWAKWLHGDHPANVDRMDDPAFYAVALTQIRFEAATFGVPSGIDGEPYGAPQIKPIIQGQSLPLEYQWSARLAIDRAKRLAGGGVDYIIPGCSIGPDTYTWVVRCLGEQPIDGIYYRTGPGEELPDEPTAPGGWPTWSPGIRGVWVAHADEPDVRPGVRGLPAAEALQIEGALFIYISGSSEGPWFRRGMEALAIAHSAANN